MPLYHKWKCIFIQIPKTATVSMHQFLRNNTDDQQEHISYIEEYNRQDLDLFESYFSFACVRNPYDRLTTEFEYRRQEDNDFNYDTFDDWIKKSFVNLVYDFNSEFTPQFRFITIKDFILVDEVIKYENIESDWEKIVKIINSKSDFKLYGELKKHNYIENKLYDKWGDYYTPETKEIVYNAYKKDFELFGYEKDF